MSETKEYSMPELIEFLDGIERYSDMADMTPTGKAKLTQIKDKLNDQDVEWHMAYAEGYLAGTEHQPQPDEELVRKIMIVVSRYSLYLDFTHDEAKAEIRKLLPRPSVTREEIEDALDRGLIFNPARYDRLDELILELEAKGIDVKGEK